MPQRVVLQHERQAEGRENGSQGIAAQQRTQRRDLQRRPDDGHDQGGEHECKPEAPRRRDHNNTNVGPQHEKFAVGEVHDIHDAEDEGKAGGHQRQDHAGHEPV